MSLLTGGELSTLLESMKPRQVAFCEYYVTDLNGPRAVVKASYDSARKNNKSSIAVQASRLLSNAKCKKYIAHLQAQLKISAQVSSEMVVRELMKIAFQDPGDLIEYDKEGEINVKSFEDLGEATKLIKKFKTKEAQPGFPHHGKIIEVETYDKLKALELLGKHTAIFTENVNLLNNGGNMPDNTTVVNVHINHRKKGEKLK